MCVAIGAAPGLARADWPTNKLIATGTPATGLPYGVAIRNWGPTGDVFLLIDKFTDPTGNRMWFSWYTCTGAGCDLIPVNHTLSPLAVGTAVPPPNTSQQSMAIRNVNGTLKLRLLGRQKLDLDCDNDGFTTASSPPDQDDVKGIDLQAWDWNTNTPLVFTPLPVEVNDAGLCRDTGFSLVRYLAGTAHACYTWDLNPGGVTNDQNIACNDDSAPSATKWNRHVDLGTSSNTEDHPSFDFYLPENERAVAGHQANVGAPADTVRVHFPDAVAPPNEPVVEFGPSFLQNGDIAQHPWVVTGNGKLHMVWHQTDREFANGPMEDSIQYAVCDFDPTNDCTQQSDWVWEGPVVDNATHPVDYNNGAKMAQIDVDGKNQFVVYQYDEDLAGGPLAYKIRVMFASRCEGDPTWAVEYIRQAANDPVDQSVFFGKPAMVLDRTNHLVHVALVEANDYRNGSDFLNATTSSVYWYTKAYVPCP